MEKFDLIDVKELGKGVIHLFEQDDVQGIEPVSNVLTILKSQAQHIKTMLQLPLLR